MFTSMSKTQSLTLGEHKITAFILDIPWVW